jgi:hypothetical protein
MKFWFVVRAISGSLCIGYSFYLIHKVFDKIGEYIHESRFTKRNT